MKVIKKTLIIILTVISAVTIFIKTDVKASSLGTEHVKKIVSVVYDNSGSMKQGEPSPSVQNKIYKGRYRYAAYALQTLTGLLNDNDKLIITPMNNTKGNWSGEGVEVDLTSDPNNPNKRNEVIKNLFYDPETTNNTDVEGKIPIVTGGNTPYGSVKNAIDAFAKVTDGKGLPTSDEYTDEDKNVEYWLIILTDGIFNEYVSKTKEDLSNDLISLLKDYGHLNTIYYAFGNPKEIFDLQNTTITNQLSFTAYSAEDGDAIIANMQDIANKLSRRFSLEEDYMTYDGNKVILDLNQYSTNAISFKSLSIISQNSGVKLNTVRYNGDDITKYLTKPCVLDNQGITGMKDGYLGILGMDTLFSGGTIELEFVSSDVKTNKKNFPWDSPTQSSSDLVGKVSILVEPALEIQPYFTYNNQEIDMAFVNSTLKPNDVIQAHYKIVNPIDGSEITNLDMFGESKAKVTYTGPGLLQGMKYNVDEDIKLVAGRNTINLEVVFGGKYTLLASVLCVVEVNPSIYRIDGEVNNQTNQVQFEVFHENQQKTKEELKKYDVIISVISPSGQETIYKDIFSDSRISVDTNGKITLNVDVGTNNYGRYEVSCKVVFSETDRIIRTNRQYILKMPDVIEIKSSPEDITIGEFNLHANQNKIIFGVYGDGNLINIDSSLFDYKVEVDGVDVTNKAVIKRSQGVVEFIPNTDNLPDDNVGNKVIKLILTRKDNNQTVSGKCDLVVEATRYEIKLLTTEEQRIDIYKTKQCDVEVRFKIYRNDLSLTYTELYDFYKDGSLKVDTNSFGWLTLSPYGADISFEMVEGEPEIVCKIEKDWISLLAIDNMWASFIFAESKDIEVSYQGVSQIATIRFNDVSFGSRIIRWLGLLLYALILTHLITFGLGFLILKPLPKGIIITAKLSAFGGNTTISTNKVNFNRSDIVKWHLTRFIPFRELKTQEPKKFGDMGYLTIVDGQPKVKFTKECYTTQLHIPNDTQGKALNGYVVSLSRKGSGPKPKVSCDVFRTYITGVPNLVKASVKGKKKIKNKKQQLKATISGVPNWTSVYVIQGKDPTNGGQIVKSVSAFIKYKGASGKKRK